jgi:hypothetical protein
VELEACTRLKFVAESLVIDPALLREPVLVTREVAAMDVKKS